MVTLLESVGLVLGGASLFGLIVGLFSVYNGRATRKLILEEMRGLKVILERIENAIERMDRRIQMIEDRIVKL